MEMLELEKLAALRRARKGLLAFTKYTMPDFEVSWHHRRVCQAVNAALRGDTVRALLHQFGLTDENIAERIKSPDETGMYCGMTSPGMLDLPLRNLMVSMGPRHGKTELISRRLPAFAFGLNPNLRVIACSYGADLASLINRDVQRIIDEPRYAEIFPDTTLSSSNVRTVATGNYLRNSDIFEIVGHRGGYRSAGIGGGITGMGADLALIDDPHKNELEAASPVTRAAIWEWYKSTLYTRLSKSAIQIVIQTRWRTNDLSGMLQQQALSDPEAEQFYVLSLPALLDVPPAPGDPREQGEALWPQRFDERKLQRTKRTMGSRLFAAMYQQRPAPLEGHVVQSQWWRYYRALPDNLDTWAISCDLTFGDAEKEDYCVMQVWARKGASFYLVDQIRAKMGFTVQCAQFSALASKWPQCRAKWVEKKANGAALINSLRDRISGIVPVEPRGTKMARAESVSPLIEAGNVYLPDPATTPWVADYLQEWQYFPNGANDDQIDATSQALQQLSGRKKLDYKGMAPISLEKKRAFT